LWNRQDACSRLGFLERAKEFGNVDITILFGGRESLQIGIPRQSLGTRQTKKTDNLKV
jgi:hypothetical protein